MNLCGSQGSAFLADECFRVWDFKEPADEVDAYVRDHLMATSSTVVIGANDPTKINFTGHQKNFEEVVHSIRESRPCAIDGKEARKAVALICAIYQSAANQGQWIEL